MLVMKSKFGNVRSFWAVFRPLKTHLIVCEIIVVSVGSQHWCLFVLMLVLMLVSLLVVGGVVSCCYWLLLLLLLLVPLRTRVTLVARSSPYMWMERPENTEEEYLRLELVN